MAMAMRRTKNKTSVRVFIVAPNALGHLRMNAVWGGIGKDCR
jgi:hypothetical protein